MMISDRFKHAIKTALAVVIAYGIALAMDWEKPIWAGYTVFAISLMTSGQGVQKGFLRLAGSMCGAIAGLAILAAFAQDRWLFIAALSIVLAICAYLGMGTKRFNYFWQQAGFFGAVVGFDTAFNPANAFQIAVERAQETATGIVVYTVIALLLWPRDSRMDMERIASRLVASLHQLFNAYTAILRDEHDGQASAGLRAQATALQVQFGTLLDAAVIDSGEVKNMRPAWRRGQALMADLGSTLDRGVSASWTSGAFTWTRIFPPCRRFKKNSTGASPGSHACWTGSSRSGSRRHWISWWTRRAWPPSRLSTGQP